MPGAFAAEGLAAMEPETLIQLLRQMQTHQSQVVAHPVSQRASSKEDHGLGRSSGQIEGRRLRQRQMQVNAVSQKVEERDGDKQTLVNDEDVESAIEEALYHRLLHQMHPSMAAEMNQNIEQRLSHMSASRMPINSDGDIESSVEAATYHQRLHQMQASVASSVGQNSALGANANDGAELAEASTFRQLLHQMQLRQLQNAMASQAVPQSTNPQASRAEEAEEVGEGMRSASLAATLYVNTME